MLVSSVGYDDAKARFFDFSKQMQGLSPMEHLSTLGSLGIHLRKCKGVNDHQYSLSDPMDEAMRFLLTI